MFDGVGTKSLLRSYKTLRIGGRLIGYGFGSTLKDGRQSSISNSIEYHKLDKCTCVKLDTGQEKNYSLQHSNVEKT